MECFTTSKSEMKPFFCANTSKETGDGRISKGLMEETHYSTFLL